MTNKNIFNYSKRATLGISDNKSLYTKGSI